MFQNKLNNTLKTITLSLLIFSSGAFAMKKADFIKSLNNQIAELQAERDQLLSANASATEYIILQLEAEIAELMSQRENLSL